MAVAQIQAEVEHAVSRYAGSEQMRKNKTRSTARFWTILTVANIIAIGYVFGLYLRADSSDTQLFAAMALVFVAFFVVILDIVSIMLAYEVWTDQRY